MATVAAVWAEVWAEVWSDVLRTPLKVLAVLLIGVIARWLLHRVIDRAAERIATGNGDLDRAAAAVLRASSSPQAAQRREQRARTTASVLRNLTTGVVLTVVLLTVLSLLDIPVAPLLASAGIAGVALGFGAQALVKDVISGLFMLAEDQYGVGDVVDLGAATGTVEAVGLRVTQLRDDNGTLWYLRNGEVVRVGNRSQGWGVAKLDVRIAYGENVSRASELLLAVAREVCAEPELAPSVLAAPEVAGVESMSADGVVLQLSVRTKAQQQDGVARELRRRLKERFDAEGVRLAPSRNAVWVAANATGSGAGSGAATPAASGAGSGASLQSASEGMTS